jgi:hypothetical protein
MGLFNFSKKKPTEPELKNSMSFYNDCVADFHKEAMKKV